MEDSEVLSERDGRILYVGLSESAAAIRRCSDMAEGIRLAEDLPDGPERRELIANLWDEARILEIYLDRLRRRNKQ